MAWINELTYEVLQTLNDGYSEEDYIEIDDMIAQPVSVLNQKGFKTTACCAGHPFPSAYLINTEIKLNDNFDVENTTENISPEIPSEYAYIPIKTYKTRYSYIEFDTDVPDYMGIPEGWQYDPSDRLLYTRYTKKADPYIFFEQQLEKMKALNTWAMGLK